MVLSNIRIFAFFLVFSLLSFGQNAKQEKMSHLNFMVGEWIGTSKSFEDGQIKNEVAAYEKISYNLDQHILTIDLHSETLQLHTVIYYDEKDETYYYNPFYKDGAATYKAEFINNKFIVNPTKTKRFVFGLTEEGNFVEYGEILNNGKWIKYFEDVFKKTN